jgi:hypothetical protein
VRRKRIFIVLVVCVLVGIGVVAFWPGEREPEYNGKKLSEWLNLYEEARFKEDPQKQRAGAEAVQHIGTNALPWLVKWIEYGRPAWKDRLVRFVVKIPSSTIIRWYTEGDRLGFGAVMAFEVLGPKAAPAVPELARIASRSGSGFSQMWAMDALSHIGREAFPTLLVAMGNRKTEFGAALRMSRLAEQGVDIGPAMPALLLIDRHTREHFQKAEKMNSGPLFYDPLHVTSTLLSENRPFLIPALTNCLHHTNSDVRVEAAEALGSLRDRARPAVPALKEALDDRVIAVQEAAINALEKIAPEVLTNGVKKF